ncbi:hypothetical protein TNCV_84521 [Trichonephila clavipes]|nr:hypothetical protein TNCV_84521 [Trichonephila clavipes]
MPRVRSRNAFRHVSDFDKRRIVAYRDCGLSYHSTAVRFDRDSMTPCLSPTLHQDNAQTHVAGIVRTFLDMENVRLLLWPARSPDLSPIENVWSRVAKRLARHPTPVTTVDAVWSSVPIHAIQSLTQCPGV